MNRFISAIKYSLFIVLPILLNGCINYWYPPANSLPTRPVYVYGKKAEPTVNFGFHNSLGQNKGESSQMAIGAFRVGARYGIIQSFVGLSAYDGFYKVGAIDSIYQNKSAYGLAIEWEGNLVIPIHNVNFGAGIYLRGNSEWGDYTQFREYYQANPDIDADGERDVDASYTGWGDLHLILNIHSKLDFTFIYSQFAMAYDNQIHPIIGCGISSQRWGGWVTISSVKDNQTKTTILDLGISYRLGK